MTETASTHLREVLDGWGLVPDRVRRISTGGNLHWRVQQGTEVLVLRRYREGQTAASIRYELDVLAHLHERGWPVAAPLDAVRWHQGRAFALFPYLPGRARRRDTRLHQRERGQILAQLHRDLDGLTRGGLGQRDGWERVDEVVLSEPRWTRRLAADERGASWPPALVRAVAAHWQATRDWLVAPAVQRFPAMVVHGDLAAHNLRFEHGKLSGLLDLDATHLDLRAADVACARRGGFDGRGDDVVRGYLETESLSDAELANLDVLWRATVLRYAAALLDDSAVTTRVAAEALRWCVRQLDKTTPFDP